MRPPFVDVSALPGSPASTLVRWYLEDYAKFPADPAPVLAASAEGLLAREGAELFRLERSAARR